MLHTNPIAIGAPAAPDRPFVLDIATTVMSGLKVDGLAAIAGDDMRSGRRLVGSRSNTIAGGTTEVMKNIIGERSLGLPREPKV